MKMSELSTPVDSRLCSGRITRALTILLNKIFYIRFNRDERTRSTVREEAGPSSSSSTEERSRQTREDEEEPQASTSTAGNQDEGDETDAKKDEEDKDEMAEAVLTEEDLIQQSQADYDSGRYSPTLLTSSELPLDSHATTPEEDLNRLQLARRQLQVTGTADSG